MSRPARSASRSVRRALPAALLLNVACYQYVAVAPSVVPEGTDVRVRVADATRDELTRVLGPRAVSLDGRVVSSSDASLTLAVQTIRRTSGSYESWGREPVAIPRVAIADVTRRQFSAWRSGVLAAGVVALGLIVSRTFGDDPDVGSGRVPPPSTPR